MTKMRLDSGQENHSDCRSIWYSEPISPAEEQGDAASLGRPAGRRLEDLRAPDERPTVLVVEDEVSIAEVIGDILEEAGYRALIARNGRVALAIVRYERPVLVLTDRMMPEVDGVEFVRLLRASPITHTIPVVMMSSTRPEGDDPGDALFLPGPAQHMMTSMPLRCQRVAVNGEVIVFLPKPFDLDDLLYLVEAMVRHPGQEAGPRALATH